MCRPTHFSYLCCFWILCGCVFSVTPVSQDLYQMGDISRDGFVDGRDALKVMQIVEGYIQATGQEMRLGDVHPYPGTDGRRIGDGVLSQDDAQKLLRYAVGLIPMGDLSGDYLSSPPRIDDFSPWSGGVGTRVTIEGKNFLGSLLEDNLVFIGGVQAPIHGITGTRIITEVPPGARTGIIRVITPGGVADSAGDFYVTQKKAARLALGEGYNMAQFTAVSAFGETAITPEGSFTTDFCRDEMTVLACASDHEHNNTFFALIIPDEKTGLGDIQVNSLSTAKALVFLHPCFMTRDAEVARMLMTLMESLPEIHAFATVIEERYAQGADGLDDALVGEAWDKAVIAVLNALPPGLATTVGQGAAKSNLMTYATWKAQQRQPVTGTGSISGDFRPLALNDEGHEVRVYGVDRLYLDAEYDAEENEISPKLDNGYSPVDWLVTLCRVDPEGLPRGLNTPFTYIREHGLAQTGYEKSAYVPANLWTLRLDIVKTSVDYSLGQMLDWLKTGGSLPLEDSEEGVYVLRMYSGAFRDYEGWDTNAIKTTLHGERNANTATSVNVVLSLVDVWIMVAGNEKGLTQEAIKNSIRNGINTLGQETNRMLLSEMNEQEALGVLFNILIEAGKGLVAASVDEGITQAKLKMEQTLKASLGRAHVLLQVLTRISALGRASERIAGLMGYLLNPLDMELSPGPTPLETMLVVVGDPFKPVITSLSPGIGGELSEVTITGERFTTDIQKNTVYFDTQQAEILSGDENHLVVRVPRGILKTNEEYKHVYISVENDASSQRSRSQDLFTIVRAPVATEISSTIGFAKNPAEEFEGTPLRFTGVNLDSLPDHPGYIVYFNNAAIDIISSGPTFLEARIPEIEPGTYETYIFDPYSRIKTKTYAITVLGKPELTSVEPLEAKAGQRIILKGSNFYSANVYSEGNPPVFLTALEGTEGNFVMPTSVAEGQTLDIYAHNPAGRSLLYSIRRLPGVTVPALETLPLGYILEINSPHSGVIFDNQISLDEATRFLRGELDLAAFDDTNRKTWIVRREMENSDGSYQWVILDQYEVAPDQPNNGTIGHEIWEYWYRDRDRDGNLTEYIHHTVDLDASLSEREEADQLNFNQHALGQRYRNQLWSNLQQDIGSIGFTISAQDTVEIPRQLTVRASNGITLEEGSSLTWGNAELGGPIVMKNAATISSSTLSFTREMEAAIQLENCFGAQLQDVTILNSPGVGIAVRGGGKNVLSGSIFDCQGIGLASANSEENGFYYRTIENCALGGIALSQEKMTTCTVNDITDCRFGIDLSACEEIRISGQGTISGCQQYGVGIQGGKFNSLLGSVYNNYTYLNFITQCEGPGIVLNNTYGNQINHYYVNDCKGPGLHIGPGSAYNTVQNLTFEKNQGGVVIEGPDTLENTFEGCNIGVFQQEYNLVTSQGILGTGLLLRNGAAQNQFNYIKVYHCAGHAVIMEGTGTNNNQMESCYIGSLFDRFKDETGSMGNSQDGIVLRDGASYNQFTRTFIGRNEGHGMRLEDETTFGNKIVECTIGSDAIYKYQDPLLKGNKGIGIVINKAGGTLIRKSMIGINLGGGIQINDVQRVAEGEAYATILDDNEIGIFSKAYENWMKENPNTVLGIGIELVNSRYTYLYSNAITQFTHGLVLRGERCSDHFFETTNINKTSDTGLKIENAQDTTFQNLHVRDSKSHGIHALDAHGLQITDLYLNANQGHGALVENCSGVVLNTMEMSAQMNATHDALHITHSQEVAVQTAMINSPGRHGIYVGEGSARVTVEGVDIWYANEAAIYLSDSESLHFLGYIPDPNDTSTVWRGLHSAKGAGIHAENVRSLIVGSHNKGLDIHHNTMQGIFITGADTEDVQILGSSIRENKEGGVVVEDGQAIRIGGSGALEGNHIESNSKAGILAKGLNTDVVILNNTIGFKTRLLWGSNEYGILLQEGIQGCLISNNYINSCRNHAVWLSGGSHHNQIAMNSITTNGGYGVLVEGAQSTNNVISRNSITNNRFEGIGLQSGGNQSIVAPVVHVYDGKTSNLQGNVEAPHGSQIEIYADGYNEGETLIAQTFVSNKHFLTSGLVPKGKNVHALVIHPDGNTSQFGSSILHLNAASPQNKTFVYTNNPTGNSDIYLNSPSLDVPQALASNPAQDTNPQLSPFNQYILFTSDRSGNRDLYMMSGTGENPHPVFAHPAEDYHPAWEPGGTRGVFVSERDGNPELYLAELDPNAIQGEISYGEDALDTTKPPVRGKQGDAVGVQFQSMAGLLSHFLIYIAADPSPFTWKILGYDGSFPTEIVIAEGEALPGAIGWNRIETHNVPIPETYLIAVYFQQENQPGIGLARGGRTGKWWSFSSESQQWQWNSYIPYMIKAFVNLPDPTRLTDHSASDVEPCWSPTGKQIVFASDRGGKMDLWVMNDDGSQLKQLTQSAGNNTKPAWSSDGTMIAFVSDRDGNPELYIIQPDGTGERRLTTFEGVDTDPAWESFGRTLLFASNRNGRMEIYQADAVNFYPARLTITNGEALEPHVAMHSRLTAKLAAKSLRPRTGSMQMHVSSGQGIPGDTIPIQVEIQGAMSVGNWEGSLLYDARLLELTQAQIDATDPGVLYAINPEAYPSDTGTIRWNWINTIGFSGNSAVLTLNFRIRNQTDPTETRIQCLAAHAYGLDLLDISLLSEDGYIQILKDPTIIQEWMMF